MWCRVTNTFCTLDTANTSSLYDPFSGGLRNLSAPGRNGRLRQACTRAYTIPLLLLHRYHSEPLPNKVSYKRP